MSAQRFTWRDGERTIVFRAGALAEAGDELAARGWDGYELLSTPRGLAQAPGDLVEGAARVHDVDPGPVPEAATRVLGATRGRSLVALGGGRVIDVAKALAAVRAGRVAAIPTTLSGAEMTRIHRFPAGEEASERVRPVLVLADPGPMTSLPEPRLRASAMNALAHGADCLYTPLANPVSRMAALRGAELIAAALDAGAGERDPEGLALGSLLCAYALDSAGLGLHHVVAQSLVRTLGTPHAETNAAVLPRTMVALGRRAPEEVDALCEAIGTEPERLGERLEGLAGGPLRLSELGADRAGLEAAVETILARPDLQLTPDPPDRAAVRALVESAW